MDPTDSTYEHYADTFSSGISTDLSGYAQIISLTTTQIKVRFRLYANRDMSAVYRTSFRFYTERLTFGTCQSVTIASNRYATSSGYFGSSPGSWTYGCGKSTHRFYVAWRFYYNTYTLNQWQYWNSGDYYDMTFNFASIGQDSNQHANYLFASSTLVW